MVRPEVDARKMFGRRHLRFEGRILQVFCVISRLEHLSKLQLHFQICLLT